MTFDRTRLPDAEGYFESQGISLKGRGKWRTGKCPLHGGDSFRANIETGAYACMGGCDLRGGDVLALHMKLHNATFVEAAQQLGAWVDDGRPKPDYKPTPLPARQALQVLAFEATLAAVAACNTGNGIALSRTDRDRLLLASNRINQIVEAYQ